MARLPPVLGRFAKAKMAISWSKWGLKPAPTTHDAARERGLLGYSGWSVVSLNTWTEVRVLLLSVT